MEAETLAEKLADASVTITARANEEGHLFGSVGPDEIAEALGAEVAQVKPGQVRLESHIKELGVYDVTIHVSDDIEVATKVWIVGE
jgi:large subunit ribosomal protein L9